MTREQFQKCCNTAFIAFRDYVPNPKTRGEGYYINKYGNRCKCSTGNMAFNASKIEFTDDRTCNLYIDDEVAPYVPFTNEKWISPKWKGHKNPNEDWFGRATYIVAKNIGRQFKVRPGSIRRVR